MGLAWSGISPANIEWIWPRVEPLLAKVIENSPDYMTTAFVVEQLKTGAYQLWLVHDHVPNFTIALVTEIVCHDAGKTCRLQLLGGSDLRSAWHLFETVIAWARHHGADGMTCYPRPGLARLLKSIGFQFVKTTSEGALFYKDILDGSTRIQ